MLSKGQRRKESEIRETIVIVNAVCVVADRAYVGPKSSHSKKVRNIYFGYKQIINNN